MALHRNSGNDSYGRDPFYARKPQRITITIPWRLYKLLIRQSDTEGRSLSNLASYWLERYAADAGMDL